MSRFEYIAGGGGSVAVDQGDGIGIIHVSGTPMIRHDPIIDTEARIDLELLAAEREARIKQGKTSWCSHKDHDGERELPVAMFDYDASRRTRCFPYCKTCRSRMGRQARAAKAAAAGRPYRSYQRRGA